MKTKMTAWVSVGLTAVFSLAACGESDSNASLDRTDLLSRCDSALSSILNDQELMACSVAFESCSTWEIDRLVTQFECDLGIIDGCSDTGQPEITAECQVQLGSLLPPDDGKWEAITGTNWCGEGGDLASNTCITNTCDAACRRHDACNFEDADGLTLLACHCDRQLYDASDDGGDWQASIVRGVFGPHNALWPCFEQADTCVAYNDQGVCTQTESGSWAPRYWNKYSGSLTEVGYKSVAACGVSAATSNADCNRCP